IEQIRADRRALLNGANLPLPGLSVEGGKLLYQGKAWDCMSGSEQLRVATAIVRCLNPECGFVLLDKLEQMDMQTLADFGAWLEANGLQAIATRVSTGDECSIIIEDGWAQNAPAPAPKPSAGYVPGWNKTKEG
ncbi:MAG: chromosome segregation protein SMC, partial [Oscillospiraceae bacterium]|nr:chromosome segregation protein SMC [Oscillospiraceae bacterium]